MDLFVLPVSEAAALPQEYCAARFPNRLARSRSFYHNADRLRCIGAGALIAHIMKIDESEIIEGAHGKIDAAKGMHFNLSHSGDYVILARHEFEVGADIETIAESKDRLAARVFQPDEIEWMQNDSRARFYALWTMKESVLKLTGSGFSVSPQSFSVLPILLGRGMPLSDRMVYGAGLRIANCAAAICAYERFSAPEPKVLTAEDILRA